METTVAQTPTTPTTPATGNAGRRPSRSQAVLEVKGKQRLSPRLLRVTLGGEGYANLNRNHHTDAYVKLLIASEASGLTPPYDLDAIREEMPEHLPARRTYTVRHWDDEAQTIDIDVVLHGEGEGNGVAARWADLALPGSRIAMSGAGGGYTPQPQTEQHLLIGDHAALPAIAAALESMEPDAQGLALVHLDHEEDIIDPPRPEGIEVRWVIGEREQLLTEVQQLDLSRPERFQVFCHAERGLTKLLRRVIIKDAGVPREQVSVSAYWALGRIEDQFQAEKREPIGKIDD